MSKIQVYASGEDLKPTGEVPGIPYEYVLRSAYDNLLGQFEGLQKQADERSEGSPTCVLQDWVMDLHLRCQGVLVSSVRGCDTIPKEHPLKDLVRVYRSIVLNAVVKKPSSFIEHVDLYEAEQRMGKVLDDTDALPMHYILHLTHASQVIGYKHPKEKVRKLWRWFYESMCHGFHLIPETEQRMVLRLEAKTEAEFIEEGRRNPYEYP